jgi:hypothetical protein
MKRIPLLLPVFLVTVLCLLNEELAATQQSSKQTATQSQSAWRPPDKTQTDARPAASVPATVARAQEIETIPGKSKTVVIPAGSIITVRLVSPPASNSRLGDTFTAIVTGLITVDGEVVVPVGMPVSGQVTGVNAAKKATEKARLKLALTSLTIDGTTYAIQTKLVTTKAQDNSKSTTATTSGESGTSAESGFVFRFTAPVTVNRQRSGGAG